MATIKPTVESIGDEALTNSIIDRSITEIQDDIATTLAPYSLASCISLKKAVFVSVTEVANKCFHGDTALEELDFHSAVEFDASALQGLSGLKTLILRSNTMCDASSGAVLSYTPIEEGTGYIYVPAALVDEYRSDFVWSGYYDQIRAIEEWPGVCDPYSWEGVAQAIDAGIYKDVYKIGDELPLDMGSEGIINMQVAAFDTDTLADGSGTAAISWVGKELLVTKHRMNPARAGSSGAYTEGAGGVGGWEKCEMRTYLKDTIKPLIPTDVVGIVEAVVKTQTAYTPASTSVTQTTQDDVWIPSRKEALTSGPYNGLFASSVSLYKIIYGETSGCEWWVRDAVSDANFNSVQANMSFSGRAANTSYGVCLGFCTGKSK